MTDKQKTLCASIYATPAEVEAYTKLRCPPYPIAKIKPEGVRGQCAAMEFRFDFLAASIRQRGDALDRVRDWLDGATSCGFWAVDSVEFV